MVRFEIKTGVIKSSIKNLNYFKQNPCGSDKVDFIFNKKTKTKIF